MPQSGMGARRGWLLLSAAAFVLSACLLGWFVRMRMQADPFARPISADASMPTSSPGPPPAPPPPPSMPSSPVPVSEAEKAPSPSPPPPEPDAPTLSDQPLPGPGKGLRPSGPVRPAPRLPKEKKLASRGAEPQQRRDDDAASGIAGLAKPVASDTPAPDVKVGTKKAAPQHQGAGKPSGQGGYGAQSGTLDGSRPVPEAPTSVAMAPQAGERGGASEAKTAAPPADPLAGSFGLSAPREMSVGVSTHVRALLAPRELTAQFETELAAAVEEVQAGGASVTRKTVTVAPQMRVELKADSDADFEIKAFTPVEQVVDREQVTVWEWAVTPKQAGERTLTAIISSVAEPGKPARTRIQRALVQVKILPVQRVREIVVAISGSLSAVAGAVGAWMGLLRPVLQRRRREGEEDGGDRRGPRPAGGGGPGPGGPEPAGPGPAPSQAPSQAQAQAQAQAAPAAAARPDGAKPAT